MTQADSSGFVSRSALKIMSGTLISRVTGMLRDMVMAYAFGTSAPLAAFLLAYRFVYLIRRLLGESLLHQGFIPRFEAHRLADPRTAARFFRDLLGTLSLVLIGLVLIGEGILFQINGEVALFMRLMLPGTIFLCLFGLTSGLLNIEKCFFIPSVSPAIFNVVWIIGVIALIQQPSESAVYNLSLIILFALFVQFAMTLPKTWNFLRKNLSIKELCGFRPFSKQLAGLSSPLLLGVLGVAAVQVNSAIDGVFARFAVKEGPAYLWYAIRMQQLPLALFALALSSALLPSLSRCFETGDSQGFQTLLRSSISKIYYLLIPCTVGIFILGSSSVNLLFGRGDFSELATTQTTLCLWGYGVGLIPMALIQILAPAFYARKEYRIPALGFLLSSTLNVLLNALFVFGLRLGPVSIALSTSLAAFFNLLYLKKKLPIVTPLPFKFSVVVVVSGLLTFVLGLAVFRDSTLYLIWGDPQYRRTLVSQITQFSAEASFFFGSIFGLLRVFLGKEWKAIVRTVFARY